MGNYYFIIIILFITHGVFAQEMLVPLSSNSSLLSSQIQPRTSARQLPLELPFADDFNQSGFYPNPSKWIDQDVFVNNNFPILPPSIGVATFDGLDADGNPYSDDERSFGAADHLTSWPINLSGLTTANNVYLSFYWQAGGLGEKPEADRDYLIVEFLNKDAEWEEVLKIKAPSQVNDFEQVFIRAEEDFLHGDFQFRLVAYGNLSGSVDLWNVDYILLDKNRNPEFESSVSDVAYVKGNGKFFKSYYQMPFKHFNQDMLKDTFTVRVKNNFLNTVDIVDNFTVKNLSNGQNIRTYNGPSTDIFSLQDVDYFYPKFDLSGVLPTTDTTIIEVKYYFESSAENASPDFVRANNEMVEQIVFGNTFAYDDGTAERAYRLINYDFSKVAVKFNVSTKDTLQAVKIYFPDFPNMTSSSKDPFFNIAIYKSLDSIVGEEDEVLYKESLVQKSSFYIPENQVFNGFAYYKFKPELNDGLDYIVVEDEFYIGIEYEKNNDVDLGFDLNNPSPENMYYNVGDGWYNTQFEGAIMMNAIMGAAIDDFPTSIRDSFKQSFKLFPNPTTDILHIELEDNVEFNYKIFNVAGALIQKSRSNNTSNINVSDLQNGWYILVLEDANNQLIGHAKFIKH